MTLYKLSFMDIQATYKFVENKELKELRMKAFIRRNFIETYGVIRFVALCWSEEEILQGMASSKKVESVKKLYKQG